MDVSLRHWPLFVTGLLLGAAGTMSLGLHRPTQMELAAAQSVAPPAAASAQSQTVVVPQVKPEVISQDRVEEQMRAAAEGFRAQEALAAAAAPFSLASAQPAKPRVRRVPKELGLEAEANAAPIATAEAVSTASTPAFEPVTRLRAATSVMGAAPATHVMPARGSAHAPEAGDTISQPQ